MNTTTETVTVEDLPGLNCGVCGYRTCQELADRLEKKPELLQRCIHLSRDKIKSAAVVDRSAPCSIRSATGTRPWP